MKKRLSIQQMKVKTHLTRSGWGRGYFLW